MKKILIIDDMKDICDCLNYILSRKGYQVLTARNGKEGLGIAVNDIPDLILMDMVMPGQDGADTVLQMKQQSCLTEVPIVFLTSLTAASPDNEFLIQGRRYPVISKLTNQDEIIRQIEQYLN